MLSFFSSRLASRGSLGSLRRFVLTLVAALSVATTAAPAEAQRGSAARARVHFQAGTHAFEEGDYSLAIQEFQAAYELTEHADLLFNIYSASERAGLLEEAADALARYLELGRPGRQRRSLEARLTRLRARVEEASATAAAAAVPAEPPREEPAAEPVAPVPPRALETAVSSETAEREPSPVARGGVHPAGVVTVVSAGVLLANFGVFAILSEVEDQALAARCGRDAGAGCAPAEVQRLEAYNLVADASWIAGAAVGAVGLALLLALPGEASESSTVAFAPWVTPVGAGGGVVGRW